MNKEERESFARGIFNQLMRVLNTIENVWLIDKSRHEAMLNMLQEYYTDVAMVTSSFVMNDIITISTQDIILADTLLVVQESSILIGKDTFIELKAILIGLKTVMDEKMGEV